jgi:hypothetical protein
LTTLSILAQFQVGTKSEISRSYNSFAGSDIKAIIGQFQFAELQAISYAISREKAPIYTMGSADPRAYSRNKRGIAGNLIWIQFDRHALLDLFHVANGRSAADMDGNRPPFWLEVSEANAPFASSIVRKGGQLIGDTRSLRPMGNETLAHAREEDEPEPRRRRGRLLLLTMGETRRRRWCDPRLGRRCASPLF